MDGIGMDSRERAHLVTDMRNLVGEFDMGQAIGHWDALAYMRWAKRARDVLERIATSSASPAESG